MATTLSIRIAEILLAPRLDSLQDWSSKFCIQLKELWSVIKSHGFTFLISVTQILQLANKNKTQFEKIKWLKIKIDIATQYAEANFK